MVDDQVPFRKAILHSLLDYPNISCIGQASNGSECLELLKTLKPEVILLDLRMPGLNGNDTFDILRNDYPSLKVIILSQHHEEGMIDNFIRRGVKGYLSKDHVTDDIDILAEGINEVSNNKSYFYSYDPKKSIKYTKRETEVILKLIQCKSSKEIGNDLNMEEKQVSKHRGNLYRKTKTRNGSEFMKYSIENGLEFLGRK